MTQIDSVHALGQSLGREAPVTALYRTQKEIEDEAADAGRSRFLARLKEAQDKRRAAVTGAGVRLVSEIVAVLEGAIREAIVEPLQRPGGNPAFRLTARLVQELGTDVAAYITARTVLNALYTRSDFHGQRGPSLQRVAFEIARYATDELKLRVIAREQPLLFDWRLASVRRRRILAYHAQRRRMLQWLDDPAIETEVQRYDLPRADMLRLGLNLFDVLRFSTGLVELREERRTTRRRDGAVHVRRRLRVVPAPETMGWLSKRNDFLMELRPVLPFMVVPPLSWRQDESGGYRYALREVVDLIESDQEAPEIVREAVNRVQSVPWRVNRRVLELAKDVERTGGGRAGIPSFREVRFPDPPDEEAGRDERKGWKRVRHQAFIEEYDRQVEVRAYAAIMATADKAAKFERVWFPCFLDFRGRMYPASNYLHPQERDLARALLEFAEGKPVGEDGATWLAIHGANCLGTFGDVKFSRLTLQERVDWITEHSLAIRQAAERPWDDAWWTEADDPLQFWRFCLDWMGYLDEGPLFVSHLPVWQDATASGMQHFSAAFRDEQGARTVNLVDAERPSDLYQQVADRLVSLLEKDVQDDEMARLWLWSGLVDRKLVKRPVMTFVYGATLFGFRDQLLAELTGRGDRAWIRKVQDHFAKAGEGGVRKDRMRQACSYLARRLLNALGETSPKAVEAMKWLQRCAWLVSRAGAMVAWSVPVTGLRVEQGYEKSNWIRVRTKLAGETRYYNTDVKEPVPGVPEGYKQANAVAPNWIHSLDAAVVHLVAAEGVGDVVTSVGTVHDSFATHAATSGTLADVVRRAFVRIHSEPVAERMWADMAGLANVVLPPPPDPGDLDVGTVLISTYFC